MGKLLLIALTIYCTNLYAQYDRPFFNTITTHNGLPEAFVKSSLQDKFGYLWFGTQQGLVRYDGYQTKIYAFSDDNGEFVKSASVEGLFEDNRGLIWAVLMHHGIYYLDRKKDFFVKAIINDKTQNDFDPVNFIKSFPDNNDGFYWIKSSAIKIGDIRHKIYLFDNLQHNIKTFSVSGRDGNFLPCYRYCDLLKDNAGKIWAAADSMLYNYNPKTHSFNPYFVLPGKLKISVIGKIIQDPVNPDLLWITTADKVSPWGYLDAFNDVVQFNKKTKGFKIYANVPGDSTSIPRICNNIFTDSLKRVWFATRENISLFNRQKETFTNFPLQLSWLDQFGPVQTQNIASDPNGDLWIGGDFKELVHLDITAHKAIIFEPVTSEGELPDFVFINNLFFDRSGILWVSLPWTGLAYLDLKRSWFNPLKIKMPLKKDAKASSNPFHVVQKMNDSIFLVSNDSKLFTWVVKNNSFKEINLGENKSMISGVYIDRSELMWISTIRGGLICYDPVTKKVKTYKHDQKDSASLGSNIILAITQDSDKNLWIGTADNGLNFYNRKTGKFKRYPFIVNDNTIKADNVLDDRAVLSLHFDRQGILWIGTNLGAANRFDPKTGKFTSYLDFEKGFVTVHSLFEDSKRRLWAGTYLSGLFLFDRDKGLFRHIDQSENVFLREIRDIKEDKKGNILISSAQGLFKLNPSDESIINCSGIGSNENVLFDLDNTEIYKVSDELFYLSVKNGIIPFDPDNLFKDTLPPRVIIESIKYQPAVDQKNSTDTTLFIPGTDNIELRYNENKIVFQYTALHYINALSTQYAYKLAGYDKDWVQAGAERTATYTNLSPGNYTFRVKAANNDHVWSKTDTKFTVIILPPWWQTWWAYASYVILFLIALSMYVKWRERLLKKEKVLLEEKVNVRTHELQQEKEKVERTLLQVKELQAQLVETEKMNERLRISRELHDDIGGTLSGIVLYSHLAKNQIHGQNTDEVKKSLNVIQQSANNMVSKLSDIVWSVNPHHNSLKNLVQKLEEYATEMAAAKNIKVQVNTPECLAEFQLPVDIRHNIYLLCKEAINNAIKYSEASILELSVHQSDHTLEFAMSDNGKGFDLTTVKKGNGLLNMQKRADEIGAKLVVRSTPEQGTVLSLLHPVELPEHKIT